VVVINDGSTDGILLCIYSCLKKVAFLIAGPANQPRPIETRFPPGACAARFNTAFSVIQREINRSSKDEPSVLSNSEDILHHHRHNCGAITTYNRCTSNPHNFEPVYINFGGENTFDFGIQFHNSIIITITWINSIPSLIFLIAYRVMSHKNNRCTVGLSQDRFILFRFPTCNINT
jgi:hypothetical protein